MVALLPVADGSLRRRRPLTGVSDPLVAEVLEAAASSNAGGRVRRAPTEPPIRLIIVDQQRVVLLGLRAVFGAARNCEVVAEATTAEQAVRESRELHPDVVVMDADLPGASGVVACQVIRSENLAEQVVMFGSAPDATIVIAAIRAGARGYLLKRTEPGRLVNAVETVASGGVFFDDPLTSAVQEWFQAGQPGSDPVARLTQQERRILRLIASGKTNRAIALELDLSEYTVKTYVSAALRKLNLTSRAEAAAFIIRHESTATA